MRRLICKYPLHSVLIALILYVVVVMTVYVRSIEHFSKTYASLQDITGGKHFSVISRMARQLTKLLALAFGILEILVFAFLMICE